MFSFGVKQGVTVRLKSMLKQLFQFVLAGRARNTGLPVFVSRLIINAKLS